MKLFKLQLYFLGNAFDEMREMPQWVNALFIYFG